MFWQVSCGHFLSCCLENRFRKNRERDHQGGEGWGGGTVSTLWNSNDLTKKVPLKLYKSVINQKLHHFTYLACTVCFVPT